MNILKEIEYSDMFSPSTMKVLKGKSEENLRRVGSAMANARSTQTLFNAIKRIEEPYRRELEDLAQVIVRDTYGVVNDNNIEIRAFLGTPDFQMPQDDEENDEIPSLEIEVPIDLEAKRRIINSITQGGGIKGTFAFYMMKEYLDQLDPSLVDSYKDLMEKAFGVYDDDNALAMMLAMMARGPQISSSVGGSVETDYDEEEDKFIINAQAEIFPVLVHEIIKGLYEILALEGFSQDTEQNQDIIKTVDKVSNEPEDLRYGKYIYESISDFVNTFNIEDNRVRDYFLSELYRLDSGEFINMIENIIKGTVKPDQRRWAETTIRQIEDDLRKDDTGLSGLDYTGDEDDEENLAF